jgi:hypothetical protein
MSQKVVATSDLIKWCDDQVANGHELVLAWDGGGDSGWCYFKIDGEQVSDSAETDEIRDLTDRMYDHLDYGSWAGEFSASGEAVYDSKEKAFVGTDYYSEDETYQFDHNIKITVPKSLWFDALEYNFEGENPNVSVVFTIRNGFLTDLHTKVASQIEENLEQQIQEGIDAYNNMEDATEYHNIWQNDRFTRSEFKEEGDNLVAIIEELNIGTSHTLEKDIYLELITDEDEY